MLYGYGFLLSTYMTETIIAAATIAIIIQTHGITGGITAATAGVGVGVTAGGNVGVTAGAGVGVTTGAGVGGLNAKHAAHSGFGSQGSSLFARG